MGQIQVGRVVLEITQISGDNGLRVPAELTMLGKTLLNLTLVGQHSILNLIPTLRFDATRKKFCSSGCGKRYRRPICSVACWR